ncbi:hypothetical protein TNCV_4022671 [Trichonephila clavipes]|nr:hypothetical protein TNCV_4022671 [Trichonephila clavipes]
MLHYSGTRGQTDLVILNHGQVTSKPELAFPLLTTTPTGGRLRALDEFNVYHHPPTRTVFSGTRLEFRTRQPRSNTLTTRLPRPSTMATDVRGSFADSCHELESGYWADLRSWFRAWQNNDDFPMTSQCEPFAWYRCPAESKIIPNHMSLGTCSGILFQQVQMLSFLQRVLESKVLEVTLQTGCQKIAWTLKLRLICSS